MQATTPHVEVPGDNPDPREIVYPDHTTHTVRPHIMARSGNCVGMDARWAVWRFGFGPKSSAAAAYGVKMEGPDIHGFMWVLATRHTGKIKETFFGFAGELPPQFRAVLKWEPPVSPHRDLDTLRRGA